MPPISSTHHSSWEHSSPTSWNAAPYTRTRSATRQRTTSLHEASGAVGIGSGLPRRSHEHSALARIGLDYQDLSPTSLYSRKPLSAGSDGSYKSLSTLSHSSVSTAPSSAHLLTDSPATLSKLDQQHLLASHLASKLGASDELGLSHSRHLRARRGSLGPDIDALSGSVNVPSRWSSNMEPPRVQDPFAPLSFDAMAADEADGAGLPPSMRPWNPEPPPQLQRGRSQSVLLPSIRHGRGLDRSASRSPERARSSYPAPTSRNAPGHPRTSAPTSEADKAKLVEGLVYAAVTAIQVLWTSEQDQQNHHIKLYQFVKELLRRSRSTCSTLQVALYYIHRSRDAIRERVRLVNEAKAEVQRMQRSSQAHQSWDPTGLLPSPSYERYNIADLMSPTSRAALLAREQDPMGRGREMFLSALVCASKFLQDRTYSNQAWSKISSLPVQVINANEKAFLEVMDYNLFVNSEVFRSCQYLLSPDAWTSADSLLDEGTRRLSELAERKGTKRGPEFPERTDRKQPPRPPTDSMSRPHLKLSIPRDGVLRAHSDYLPPPDLHDMLKYPSPRSKVPYPLTPTDTPRISPESPEEYTRTPPPSLHASFPLVGRSNTDTRLALRNTDKLQPPLGFNAPGRLPIPRLSSRLTRSSAPAAGPSNAMDLDDADDIKVSQIRQPRPRIPLRNTTSLVPYTSMEQLPRPMLTSNRFASASMMDASRFATHSSNSSSSGSCASLARLLNGTNVDDWQNGDQMVL